MKRVGGLLALSLVLASPGLAAPRLAAYGVNIAQTSVSGVSSGGAMAVQIHIAHSSIMRGIGVIAGIAYGCADLPLINQRVAQITLCLNGTIPASFSLARTAEAVAAAAIDDPAAQLPRQKVWLFSGYNDGSVRRAAMDAVAEYYQRFVPAEHTFYKTNNHAPHALITGNYGGRCLGANAKYINNCAYDAAGRLLEHIYGGLSQPRPGRLTGRVREFDQSEFVDAANPALLGFADKGYVYVPKVCESETCRVHVVFHGCKQYAGKVGDAVYKHAGYNPWADANKLIVLYPQTIDNGRNLDGCWDWWGFNDFSPGTVTFARISGQQIAAIKAMLDRLAQGFVVAAGAADSFGPPQDVRAPDATANSVALIWRPNRAATGFNIYRSLSSGGATQKLNGQPVSGASFVDHGLDLPGHRLSAVTTYSYEVRAIDAQGAESAPTPLAAATAPEPPACEPYFSDNSTHVILLRAYPVFGTGGITAEAVGSGEAMGPLSPAVYSQLIKVGADFYQVRYCP